MSAVPKKNLCWNCEGNVSKEIDNCPYCGVYVHAAEIAEDSSWNPTYYHSKTEQIHSSFHEEEEKGEKEQLKNPSYSLPLPFSWKFLFSQLKKDVFPSLFLMTGSIFFLFGTVVTLFSHEGFFTLQWQSSYGYYFLFFAVPLIGFGWKYLHELESE